MLLSVIIPVFNEEEIVAETYRVLEEELKDIEHELIFVNDGSKDKTREILERLLPGNPNNKIINFSRNFGHQAAFSAGLDHAAGDAVVIIDGDLQDPPSLIHEMLEKWHEGYQVVYAQRNKRKGETIFKRFTAFCFYLCWVGFKKIGVKYDRAERTAGTSKYPLKKMMRLAFDGITGFSSAPLKVSFYMGVIATIVGLGVLVWSILEKFLSPATTVPGWASLMTAIVFFAGVQLMTIGILGEYIGRIYDEVKQRPLYIEDKGKQR